MSNKYRRWVLEYLRLLCELSPLKVLHELKKRKEFYSIEQSIKICEQYGVHDACAYLYQREMDFDSAVRHYMALLKAKKIGGESLKKDTDLEFTFEFDLKVE